MRESKVTTKDNLIFSHKTDQNYWKGINADGWEDEALGMRKMITQFANIPAEEVKGILTVQPNNNVHISTLQQLVTCLFLYHVIDMIYYRVTVGLNPRRTEPMKSKTF